MDSYATPTSTDPTMFVFKTGAEAVPVNFVKTSLTMKASDKDETEYTWSMDVAWIDPKYQNSTYFDRIKENVLGIAPTWTEGLDNKAALDAR